MSKSTGHGKRPDPYILDDLFVDFHRSAIGIAWRWRAELILVIVLTAVVWQLTLLITFYWALGVLGALVLILLAVPVTRRFITRRFWCVITRHRLHRLCWEARLHTRSGRLPLVLWIRPTKVGERAHILCRAGICAEDFDDNAAEIAAACYAREARVTRNRRWSHLVTIDIIRHDTLAAANSVESALQRLTDLYQLGPFDDAPGQAEDDATQPEEAEDTREPQPATH